MNLRQFRYVVALVEHRNFHRAAIATGVSQSALSQAIQKIEEEFGVLLFERDKREVSPTAYGVAIASSAQDVLQRIDRMTREVGLMKNLKSGRLIVGADTLVAEALLSPALGRMLKAYPDLRFSVRVGPWDAQIAALLAGGIDIYVGSPSLTEDSRLKFTALNLPPTVAACRPGHPLTQLKQVTLEDCFKYPIAAATPPPWHREWLAQHFGATETKDGRDVSSYFLDCNDYGIVRWLVRHTDAITGIHPLMIAEDVREGKIVSIPIVELNFALPIVIGSLRERPASPAAAILAQEIAQEAERQWAATFSGGN